MVMFVIKRSKSRFIIYQQELIALFLFVGSFILLLSLYSYNPQDPSWFYYSSSHGAYHNVCGFLGAHIAALLFYIVGFAAFAFIPYVFFLSYLLIAHRAWHDEWERIVAGGVTIVVLSIICFLHDVRMPDAWYAGGLIGSLLGSSMVSFLDHVGSLLCMYTIFLMCLILLFRFSFIHMVYYSIVMSRSIRKIWKRYRMNQRIYSFTNYIICMIVQPIVSLVLYVVRLSDGSLARDADRQDLVIHENGVSQQLVPQAVSMPQKEPEIIDETLVMNDMPDKDGEVQKRYGLPNLDLFIGVDDHKEDPVYRQELEKRAHILEEKLERFGVYGKVISIKNGPVVTLFEYQPQIDTKLSKILALEDDLALALQALSIRIIAPIPGRAVVGFEVSNRDRKDVLLAKIVQSVDYQNFSGALPLILGEDTIGANVIVDLAKMPHLLVAGSTGSGKSVALNAMLISLLCRRTPEELKLILIDPKRLEFAPYADIAHLLFPIITDPKRSGPILRWVVKQMELRYEKMAQYGSRNMHDYNAIAKKNNEERFPFIVVVIDELSDLMMTVGREIEDLITRITQMARAAGIHMIVATQRPSVDVITGLIKVNFPSRISFRVTSKVDSRTIIDCGGADKLLGRGDMLFLDSTSAQLRRVHGAYVSDREIEEVIKHIRAEQPAEYLDLSKELTDTVADMSQEDEQLYNQVLTYLDDIEEISISSLQRKFHIGYNRSARIIDMLESQGLIMPADGGKTRRIIR
jgi:DNA segregation ATPase FtsK/SpoIIIE and related proteins